MVMVITPSSSRRRRHDPPRPLLPRVRFRSILSTIVVDISSVVTAAAGTLPLLLLLLVFSGGGIVDAASYGGGGGTAGASGSQQGENHVMRELSDARAALNTSVAEFRQRSQVANNEAQQSALHALHNGEYEIDLGHMTAMHSSATLRDRQSRASDLCQRVSNRITEIEQITDPAVNRPIQQIHRIYTI